MSRRSRQEDTPADVSLKACINSVPPRSFIMKAGAGSGKTTSLIKGLVEILDKHGNTLRSQRRRVACITYTEVAANEIWEEVGNNPLVHVSTIHSFLWTLIRSFQPDIKAWVTNRIAEKIAELREAAANFGPRVQQRTREKNARDIERYVRQQTLIGHAPPFSYGTGSDYSSGILGHDDIIKMVPQLLIERPLLRTLLAQQFPFVFVDESQDTFERVVEALKAVDQQEGARFCLGFFGDPMQQIFPNGSETITLEQNWIDITKPENFRCPTSVLNVANAIRRDGDGLQQTRGQMIKQESEWIPVVGTANIFVLQADHERDAKIARVRAWASELTGDPQWRGEGDEVKMLVVVHRMAATRLGFGGLYAAMNDRAPSAFTNGFLDSTSWPLRPFMNFILPLSEALLNDREFEAIQILRNECPLLKRERIASLDVAQQLATLRNLTIELRDMMAPNSATTVGALLRFVHTSGLYEFDPRFLPYLNPLPATQQPAPATVLQDDEDETSREIASMDALFACRAAEFWGYRSYFREESPFSTQQGIKGREFQRVLVVIDDEEGSSHRQFSYDKYFGITPPSANDRTNIAAGKETSVERTRRLFYVCCTRSLKDLVVVMFTPNVPVAIDRISALSIFPEGAIHTIDSLPDR